jgi:predicted metal-dependent enzyme (double-stranded beta helix superfamily)
MNDLTMDDVASNAYLPSASLSPAAQVLYQCVAGEKFVLNTPDFPDFSKAIEYSIATPGLWCNTRLAQKATEFGKDPQPLETYLRITLGQNNGQSPGIPYVMEIWPVGHYSPVHNHSGANAIIRVLHGSIHVSLFPYLCDESESVDPFATKDFKTGDITWISSTLNQVHQLKNLETNTETCITIQCYLYDETDKEHYDYFDYLGDKNAKNQYEPDSDMDFVDFKKLMQKEWNNRTTKKGILNIKRYKNLFG